MSSINCTSRLVNGVTGLWLEETSSGSLIRMSAKVGILICYDSEFPELARMQAEEGMQILFVPFGRIPRMGISASGIVLRLVR